MNTIPYTEKTSCRACGSGHLYPYLDLGDQPLANDYRKTAQPYQPGGYCYKREIDNSLIEPTAPLQVNFCARCCHSQLSVVVDPKAMYTNYLYVTGTSATLRAHHEELAKDAIGMICKRPTDRIEVLDIGCNDGTLMKAFEALGCRAIGVDPAKNLYDKTRDMGLMTQCAEWSEEYARERFKLTMDIITATNVFAHCDDSRGFLEGCKIALNDRGVVIIEVPYGSDTLNHNEFDQVYHEHLSYWNVVSMKQLAADTGFNICRIKLTPIHGGSIRFFLSLNLPEGAEVEELVEKERKAGLHTMDSYREFALRCERNKADMRMLIHKAQTNRRPVVCYGASAKGNTMLNYFDITPNLIVDDNPLKWGYYSPGKNIPIVPPSALYRLDQPLIVVTAWNFEKEIRERVHAIRQVCSEFAFYVPTVLTYHAGFEAPTASSINLNPTK